MGVYYVVLLVKTRKAGSSGTGLFPPQSFHFSCSSFSFRCFFLSFSLLVAMMHVISVATTTDTLLFLFFAETFSNSSFIPASADSLQHASCPLSKKVIRVLILGAKTVPCVVAHEYVSVCQMTGWFGIRILPLAMTSRSSSSACFRPTWTSVTRRSVLLRTPYLESSRVESGSLLHRYAPCMHYHALLCMSRSLSLPLIVSL